MAWFVLPLLLSPFDPTTDSLRRSRCAGGTGGFKLGSNYAGGVVPQQKAAALGYQQILWLYGEEHRLTEVGTMNLFVVLEDKDGSESSDVCFVFERLLILLSHSHRARHSPTRGQYVSASLHPLCSLADFSSTTVILPGVTRDSILSLARSHAEGKNTLDGLPAKFKVTERNLTSESLHLTSSQRP